MINLTKGNTEIVYFTGTEKATLTNPYFLFIFTNRITLDTVKVMATNTSTTDRYDKFSLIVDDYFDGETDGFWEYEIREKASNVDMTVAGTIVETGYMVLNPAVAFEPTEYAEQSNEFTTYNG
jgi:hypothetical protein